jgi:FG-GAP-like repeat
MTRLIWSLLLGVTALCAVPGATADQFKLPAYYHVGPRNCVPVAVVTGDFNGDKVPDLAVADFYTGVIKVLLGKGDGTFTFGQSISVHSFVSNLAVGDFNGDHKLDIAAVEYDSTATNALVIFLGNGDGTFRQGAAYALGVEALSAAVADFNGDGHLDAAVTNEGVNGKGSVMVFFGKGDGTFDPPTTYDLPNYPYSVAAGDLNGDGHPDLAVAEYNAGVAVLLNKGDGKFGKPTLYPVRPVGLTDVVIADLNGHPDLVVATFQAVGVVLGTGDGKFGKATLYSTSSITTEFNPYALVVADFNLDGNPDIATVLEGGNSALFYGKGAGKFGKAIPIRLRNGGGEGIASGYFDHGQAPDLAVVLTQVGQISVLLNTQ